MDGRVVCVKNKHARTGVTKVKVEFLGEVLLPHLASLWQQEIQRYANCYSQPSEVYWLIHVLQLWFSLSVRQKSRFPPPPVPSSIASSLIKNLRRVHFETGAKKRKAFSTINGEWSCFIKFMMRASRTRLFPSLRWNSSAYGPLPAAKVRPSRDTARTLNDLTLVPKSMDREEDSYNSELLEPISLSLADDEYLLEYERRLATAIETFQDCARRDFEELKEKFEHGRQLVAESKYHEIMRQLNERRDRRGRIRVAGGYIDSAHGKHLFRESDGHPKLLQNLLAVVHYEMDGVPISYQTSKGGGGERIQGPPYWVYVNYYGKNRLIPYLGLLTADSAIALIVLILLEHPNINVESLMLAQIAGRDGRTIILNEAGENGEAIRFTVDKPRALSQKHAILSPLAQDVIAHVLKSTAPVRKKLRAEGRTAEARFLWVGVKLNNFELAAFLPTALRRAFRPDAKPWRKSDWRFATRTSHFLHRHFKLRPWAEHATLRSLRVSKGVLRWLRSGGDPVASAMEFGHKVPTTITCYIPKPLQAVMYERQVRRHQNLLIAAACANRPYLLRATDFSTTGELHRFLRSLFAKDDVAMESRGNVLLERIRNILDPSPAKPRNEQSNPATKRRRVVINNDPTRLAIVFLYREVMLSAPTKVLDTPDVTTRTTPRMWLDLASALQVPLPDALHELRELVRTARDEADRLRGSIRFPAYG
jgi:hypothetical protein